MLLSDLTESLIVGSTLFGTGGGGSPTEARILYEATAKLRNSYNLLHPSNLASDEIAISAFSVGAANVPGDPQGPLQEGMRHLAKFIGRKIAGIVPVEIGPKALATAFNMAAHMGLPVIDADIVGGRSSPEIFLETITLFNVPRVPSLVTNNSGDTAILLASSSPEKDERFLRSFADLSMGQAHVVGYPITKTQLATAVEHGTVSRALKVGEMLLQGNISQALQCTDGRVLFQGTVEKISETKTSSFLNQELWVRSGDDVAKVFIRNEMLILWINENVVLTCPDLISALNEKDMPLYSSDIQVGMDIKIIGLPATPLWRTSEGQKLFAPEVFGFQFKPTLL